MAMNTEDVIFSHLRTRYPELLATALGGMEPRRSKVLPIALPTVRKVESDFALQVLLPAPRHVLHIEHWSTRGSLALAAYYHMWYHEATGLPVRTLIVTTSPRLARAVPAEYTFRVGDRPATRVPLEAVHLWRISAAKILAERQVALYPFVPVMRSSGPAVDLLAHLRRRIIADAGTERDRGNILAASYFVAEKRFGETVVQAVLGGVREMAKTTLGQRLMDQGQAIGEARGRRESLLLQMREKFGPIPVSVVRRVEAIDNAARFDALFKRILTAKSIKQMGI